jgi:hypothetical protein
MTHNFVPGLLSSIFVAGVAFKLYTNKKEDKREHFLDYNIKKMKKNSVTYDETKSNEIDSDILKIEDDVVKKEESPNNKLVMEEIPLPILEGDNTPPPFYEVDRIYNKQIISRQQMHADPIRGDIPIIPRSRGDCDWFIPSQSTYHSLHEGALGAISSHDNGVKRAKETQQ